MSLQGQLSSYLWTSQNHNNMIFSIVHQVNQKHVNPDSLFSGKTSSVELPQSLYQESHCDQTAYALKSYLHLPFSVMIYQQFENL